MPDEGNFYESSKTISEYLLFHYGKREDVFPYDNGPLAALDFPQRCAELALRHPIRKGRALDLGCAVGRSACDLSAHFEETLGIDYSHGLIAAAKQLVSSGEMSATITEEGEIGRTVVLHAPPHMRSNRLYFQQGDATRLPSKLGTFDFVLMANLIDRLPDPRACLSTIANIVSPQGILAITSPYTWLEAFTPKEKWLGGRSNAGDPRRAYDSLQEILLPHFESLETLDLPFLIREHSRKFQYSVAQATLWRRRPTVFRPISPLLS